MAIVTLAVQAPEEVAEHQQMQVFLLMAGFL